MEDTAPGYANRQGSIFAEFAALEDLQNFIKRESIPKFAEEGPEMEFKTKYVSLVPPLRLKKSPSLGSTILGRRY